MADLASAEAHHRPRETRMAGIARLCACGGTAGDSGSDIPSQDNVHQVVRNLNPRSPTEKCQKY
jgi:hypothetical protein